MGLERTPQRFIGLRRIDERLHDPAVILTETRMMVVSSMVLCAASWAASTMNSLRPWISAARFTTARTSGPMRASTRAVRLECRGMLNPLSANVRLYAELNSTIAGTILRVSRTQVGEPTLAGAIEQNELPKKPL